MTLLQVWGVLLIFVLCPLIGGLPLIQWITSGLTQKNLKQVGTGNISVSAAFYHGGQLAGVLAVLSEALKGIVAVLLARYFFPTAPIWEVIALIALVVGRYWFGKGAGTTNVVWGFVVHDWVTSVLVLLFSIVGFTLVRERQLGKLGALVLIPIITALRHPSDSARIGATVILSLLIAWIYQKIPDDLDLPEETVRSSSRTMFRFFRGDRALLSLDQALSPEKVGNKAANLAKLRRLGYPVPIGWVLPPGDDPVPLVELLHPTPEIPLVVRSSAIGEDSETASAAGQYDSFLNITSQASLEQAILRCQASYQLQSAVRYRQDQGVEESGIAVLVQIQVQSVFSGVAFSRDPIARQGDAVVIEALPGPATQVVSGQITPEQYRVWLQDEDLQTPQSPHPDWLLPETLQLPLEGTGEIPPRLIQQVAYLARHLEQQFHGVPQDIEWSYDGQHLWLLQARPITTLLPIWTRKIAAEVIPGYIHPLTWSINRPLTCGVWGELFTLVLGQSHSADLDFAQTATLHHSAAYFNASLLGQIFRRMGLPPESLEFLTRGAKFTKPPLRSTLQSIPGLLRLLRRELRLEKDFAQDSQDYFGPGWAELAQQPVQQLAPQELLHRIKHLLSLLQRATYYSILAPLSVALRQALLAVPETVLDNRQTPEVASVRSLQALALQGRSTLPEPDLLSPDDDALFALLATSPEGQALLEQFDRFLAEYGYLSEVATDIAVSTWQEDARAPRSLLAQFLRHPPTEALSDASSPHSGNRNQQGWKQQQVQRRLNLKGQVTADYSRLLAELRWSFVALEQRWLEQDWLTQPGDIFFLEWEEIQQLTQAESPQQWVSQRIAARRTQLESDRQHTPAWLVYGNDPPQQQNWTVFSTAASSQQLRGIGASPGRVEGRVVVLQSLQTFPDVNRDIILVVPYADSGWSPLLARAGGLITEVGGQLSHGAIVAREYGIPAVMNISHATQRLWDGQRVRIDGQQGIVEILN